MKRAKNLLLDDEALRWAEAYCARHETSVSRLVSDFLRWLPADLYPHGQHKSPIVARLVGAATKQPLVHESMKDFLYHDHRRHFREDHD